MGRAALVLPFWAQRTGRHVDARVTSGDDRPVSRTLYEAVGGYEKLLALAHAWHERCLADPVAAHPFGHPGQHPQHLERLAAYWSEALGGPADYTASMGTETHVWRLHVGNGEHHELNERCIALFEQALEDVDLPVETRAPLAEYFRWVTERMMGTPMEPDEVADNVPLPHWSWDGLQPTV